MTHLEGTGAKIPEISVLDTFGELSKEIEKSVEVELDVLNITLTPGGRGQLSLRGKTQTVGDVSQIIAALEKTSCFSNKVKKDKVTKSVDGRTTFRISASSSCK